MPALRVFVSSTCYDFDSVRERLRLFISSLGHEPVMSEYGDILYDPDASTHVSCIEDVKSCDMLVLLIGGRFGGEAVSEAASMINFEALSEKIRAGTKIDDEKLSVTHLEVLKAIEEGMPVYTFVKEDVYREHKVYEKNKDNPHILYPSIGKQETAKYIFEFINLVRLRKQGNSVFPFDRESKIEEILKNQWSCYFQSLLKGRSARKKANNIALEDKIDSLQELIKILINDKVEGRTIQVSPEKRQKKHKKILWVDDRPANNTTVIKYYEGHGILFDTALTTAQGVKLFKENSYDLVITDLDRWNEDEAGVKLIKELQHLNCRVPVIVFSSRASIKKYLEEIKRLGDYKIMNRASDVISLISDIYGLSN